MRRGAGSDRSSDGGIDELTDLDAVKYYVQSKRYKLDNLVSLESE